MIAHAQVAAIERATLAAVPPERLLELPNSPGWLLGFDAGTVRRAKSAVPLGHTAPDLACVDAAEAAFAQAQQASAWRLPDLPAFDALHAALTRRGYRAEQATCVQLSSMAQVKAPTLSLPPDCMFELHPQPSPGWTALYLGPDFDPADGASRVAILARGAGTRYATVSARGQVIAAGAVSLHQGWASIHGMRTAAAWRGQGLARALAQRMLLAAAPDSPGVFLQVEQGNTAAQASYRALGFETAWVYRYWTR